MGGIAYGAMLLIYTSFADIYYADKKKFIASVAVFTVPVAFILAGIFRTLPETETFANALSTFLPVNKGSISPSYILISMVLSFIAFLVYDAFNFYKGKFDPLSWWGKNPILLYIIEFAVIGGLTAALGGFFVTASAVVSAIIVIVTAVLLTLLAYILDKKNIILKL
jgi:fucose 4-O-acetylase-like acetyltransferase